MESTPSVLTTDQRSIPTLRTLGVDSKRSAGLRPSRTLGVGSKRSQRSKTLEQQSPAWRRQVSNARCINMASIAQLAGHALRKRTVVGSIPTGGSSLNAACLSVRLLQSAMPSSGCSLCQQSVPLARASKPAGAPAAIQAAAVQQPTAIRPASEQPTHPGSSRSAGPRQQPAMEQIFGHNCDSNKIPRFAYT